MADSKISALSALTATPSSNDVFAIVDTSTGVTKKLAVSILKHAIVWGGPSTRTIASGVISCTGPGWYSIAGEGGSSDVLTKIAGLRRGNEVLLTIDSTANKIRINQSATIKMPTTYYMLDGKYHVARFLCMASSVCVDAGRSPNDA